MAVQILPAAAVPVPAALLRDLNRWMEAAQQDADHPWRAAIAETPHADDASTVARRSCNGSGSATG